MKTYGTYAKRSGCCRLVKRAQQALFEVGRDRPVVREVPLPILVKEEETSRIGERYKPMQSKSTDSRETYGVKAVDWESDAQVRMKQRER